MSSSRPNREVFRLAPPIILWWVWVAFAMANVADFAIEGASARFAVVVSAILVAVTGLAYALALRPRVIAEPSGLTIVNPFRDHHVPWAAIQAVDTGDWVRVHYAPGTSDQPRASSQQSSAASKAISCWALYISAGTKRRAARAVPASSGFARPSPRSRGSLILPGRWANMTGWLASTGQGPGHAGNSRLPEEAKYLASLPAAKAIAVRLDTRADRERTRPTPEASPTQSSARVTARWAWPPLAAVALPLLALLIVILS